MFLFAGKALKSSSDLQTSACKTPAQKMKKHVKEALKSVHDEVVMKYYGCGIVVPECLEGASILGNLHFELIRHNQV